MLSIRPLFVVSHCLLLLACMEPTLIAVGETVTAGTMFTDDTDSDTDTELTDSNATPINCPVNLEGWATVPDDSLTTTTGGGDAPPVRPVTFAELEAFVSAPSPQVIEISGTFDTGPEYLGIASNKTLVGVDADATIIGGLQIEYVSNVVIRNLNIQGTGDGNAPGDGISVRGSHHFWVDHCEIWDAGDGALDIISGSDFATVSWTKFYYTDANRVNKTTCLVGASSTEDATDTGKNNVTWHHNWFGDLLLEAMPRALFGKIHIFNSYYTSVGDTYCIGTGSHAGVLIEGNYFEGVTDPHRFQDTNPSYITAVDNIYDDAVVGRKDVGANGDAEPFPSPSPYSYTLDRAADVPGIVTRCAGPR